MVGLGGGATPTQARDMSLAGGAMQGDVGPTVGNATRMKNVQQGSGSAIPLLNNDPRSTYFALRFGGPQAYAKALVDQGAPSSELKALIAAGYQPGSPQYQRAAMQLANKNSYIAPTVANEGSTLFKPGSNIPFYVTAKDGMQPTIGSDGRISTSVIPGYLQGTGQIKETQAYNQGLGQARTTKDTKIDPDTGNTVGTTAADVMGLPKQGSSANSQQGAPVVTQINPVMTEIEKGNNEDWRKNVFTPAVAQGQTAKSILDSVAVLRNTDLKTGFGTKTQAEIANMLGAAGVKSAERFATSAQLFEKEGSKALLDRLATQKGSQTERDAITGRETFVRLSDTPQAKDFTLDLAQAMALQDQRKSQYFQKAANMPQVHKGKLGTISNEWSKVEGSTFDVPIGTTADGKPITMRQKYGIK
jgi:hypothetical protein